MNGRIIIVMILILAALVLFLLGLAAWLRCSTGKSAVFLAICMWGVAIYSFGYGIELLSNSLSQAEFWGRFEHWGIQVIAPTWLLFALSVSGYEKRIKPVLIVTLGVILLYLFLTAQALGWLNLAHHNPRMDLTGPYPIFTYDRNIWNYIAVGYYSLCIGASTVLFTFELIKLIPAVGTGDQTGVRTKCVALRGGIERLSNEEVFFVFQSSFNTDEVQAPYHARVRNNNFSTNSIVSSLPFILWVGHPLVY